MYGSKKLSLDISKLEALLKQPLNLDQNLEDTFYTTFLRDLSKCHSEVIIESPFITNRRVSQLFGILV
jgi:hypothetical protein